MQPETITIDLHTVTGTFIHRLFNEECEAGENMIPLSLQEVSTGFYFISIQTKKVKITKSVVVTKTW
jgi:hypothetical protein